MTLVILAAVVSGGLISLQLWRLADERRAHRAWRELARRAAADSDSVFDPAMVRDLPEPARRYFLYTIAAGTPLRTVAEIRMKGKIGLGTRENPRYQEMRAEQLLAPPHGLVWRLVAGRGLITGSDAITAGDSWVRFWLIRLVPIVREGGTLDHARAAFGRVVAESVFWTPAALLPQRGVQWEAVGVDAARALITHAGMTQTVDVTVAQDGRPIKVEIPRWSDANPEKIYRSQPFGGYLSDHRRFGGYTLPARVEGGNFIGTDAYFPFYRAEVLDVRFPR
jgi:hypothetical protein